MPPEEGGGAAFEGAACLLHELVIRRRAANLICDTLEREMRRREHPLAWLPPWLLPLESEIPRYLPHFTPTGGGFTSPHNEGQPLDTAPTAPADVPVVLSSETIAESAPLFSAVRGWAEESNGLLEGKLFRLDSSLPALVGGEWFADLPADSLAGALTEPQWAINRRTPAEAFAQLFAAAHTGGAYGRREWGAYGRLHAWQSFGALAGCAARVDTVSISAEAGRCEWFSFGGTDWFYQIADDLGLICVRPDRLSVALLAATDTD
jgi:hypothetical protein